MSLGQFDPGPEVEGRRPAGDTGLGQGLVRQGLRRLQALLGHEDPQPVAHQGGVGGSRLETGVLSQPQEGFRAGVVLGEGDHHRHQVRHVRMGVIGRHGLVQGALLEQVDPGMDPGRLGVLQFLRPGFQDPQPSQILDILEPARDRGSSRRGAGSAERRRPGGSSRKRIRFSRAAASP